MRLSVCIPTHHGRFEFLRQAVNSILPQIVGDSNRRVEICISDNASEDGTADWLEACSSNYPDVFVYRRNSKNEGYTFNLLSACAIARGEYCWLFSSDDQIAPSGIAHVLELLEEHADLAGLTVMRVNYDRTMSTPIVQDTPAIFPTHFQSQHFYSSFKNIIAELGVFFTYAPSQIVNRRLWDQAVKAVSPAQISEYSIFPHLYLIGLMVKQNPRWLWCPDPLIQNRTGNDSLLGEIDEHLAQYRIKTMTDIVRIYSNLISQDKWLFRFVMRRFYRLWWNGEAIWRHIKLSPRQDLQDDVQLLLNFTKRLYLLPEFWWQTFPVLLIPHSIAKLDWKIRAWLKFLRQSLP